MDKNQCHSCAGRNPVSIDLLFWIPAFAGMTIAEHFHLPVASQVLYYLGLAASKKSQNILAEWKNGC
jgi:hypothetical protein